MKFPFYQGNCTRLQDIAPAELPKSRRSQLEYPEQYLADSGLVDACNVALLLSQPLLLTGEPGSGKTQFAYSLAWELNLAKPLKFETKSTSESRDLFYTYDALKRFQAIQSGNQASSTIDYLTYQALGAAILRTRERTEVAEYLPSNFDHHGKQRSIVLIDEVDKAPRDFPNDILNELEQMYFRIPELGNIQIEADPDLQPLVVITSNSEKDLPDAFLRRCVYYHIPFPNRERLTQIVAGRLNIANADHHPFVRDALEIFERLRSPNSGLRKKPATAELLGWMITLQEMAGRVDNPLRQGELPIRTLGSLIKTASDQARAMEIVRQWITNRK